MKIPRVAQLRTAETFLAHLRELGITLPFDAEMAQGADAPLAKPLTYRDRTIGNRFCILPMEGWDGDGDGRPSALVRRRWQRFGRSGAKLIWGGEAVAVRADGRANPNQLVMRPEFVGDYADLLAGLVGAHEQAFGASDDLLVGLQLTHPVDSPGRSTRRAMEPQILYHHPILDSRFGLSPDHGLMRDDEIWQLIDDFVAAALLAQEAGFAFVDIKHCHGYLGHEFLSAVDRDGAFGGSFANRTRFLREIVAGIRNEAPGLDIGVRLSAFDFVPFQPDPEAERRGIPANDGGIYPYAFGGDETGLAIDLAESLAFLDLLAEQDIQLVCVTAGSPYYNPHIQRPALFPPSDGYQPPEDPLVGVARQIDAVARLKRARPELIYVGSGYSYLQEWLPNVAQAAVRNGWVDSVGYGRLILSYPEFAADVLAGRPIQRRQLCRTFSDCTTAPRNGMISGCFPLDDFYKARPEFEQLREAKREVT
ncbi:MAG: NADH:flavin oxidoreductase [Caldilineaceae bacterium]|nr:NADH:flavin oxidoreductase [Caldilineaceae bacterium]